MLEPRILYLHFGSRVSCLRVKLCERFYHPPTCMRFAFLSLALWPYHSTILIHLLHAMSSDSPDFEFAAPVGLPTAGGGRPAGSSGDGVSVEDVAPAQAGAADADVDFEFVVPVPRAIGPPRRRRGPVPLQTVGTFWTTIATRLTPPAHIVHGLVELQWELLREGVSQESGNRGGVCGTLRYSIRRVALLNNVVTMPADFDPRGRAAGLHVLSAIRSSNLSGNGGTVATFLSQERARLEHDLLICDAPEEAILRAAATSVGLQVFRDVHIYRRWANPASIIANLPKKIVLKRWRQQQHRGDDFLTDSDESAQPQIVAEPMDPLLYIPPDRRHQGERPHHQTPIGGAPVDPVRLVHALGVVRHLRSPKLFTVALDDSYEYLFQDEEGAGERGNRESDPSRSALQRALMRADMVSMSITRRMFHKWRQDDAVKAINVYSDASPVVGVELQGMLIDVALKNGETVRLILPGSTLAYGHTDTISKGVALLLGYLVGRRTNSGGHSVVLQPCPFLHHRHGGRNAPARPPRYNRGIGGVGRWAPVTHCWPISETRFQIVSASPQNRWVVPHPGKHHEKIGGGHVWVAIQLEPYALLIQVF